MPDVVEGPPAAVPLLEPRGGVRPVVETDEQLAAAVESLATASGPVAVDAERASGYRYSQRAYLVQLHRPPADIVLIDPIACPDLSSVSTALSDTEWIFHAASQDLPCLAGVGMVPESIFDTELAARLAGYERVGLGTMVEILLGVSLAKEHSAVDWSQRPLPTDWLRYAALDVDVLPELRDSLEAELVTQGKLDWAQQEFEAVLHAPPPAPRADPWRRTSGIHRIRNRRQLAVVRALWEARDELAQHRDQSPGRVLPDSAIIAAASATPSTSAALGALPGWGGRWTRQLVSRMFRVITATYQLADAELPRPAVPGDGPPPASRWPERDPIAAARLARARASLADIAAAHTLPVENLMTPELVRRVMWSPPGSEESSIADYLTERGARSWQIELTAAALADAVSEAPET